MRRASLSYGSGRCAFRAGHLDVGPGDQPVEIVARAGIDRRRGGADRQAVDPSVGLYGRPPSAVGLALHVGPIGAGAGRRLSYVNLGTTGLRVSRVCLGMMGYGAPDRPWALDESDAEPISRRASTVGSSSSTPPTSTRRRSARESPAALLAEAARSRDELVIATKVYGPTMPGEKAAACRASTSWRRSTPRCAGSASTRRPLSDPPLDPDADRGDDGGAPRRRPRGQGALHRREHHVRVAARQGAARRRAERLDAVRLDAEPLQPHLSRGGARDDPAVRRQGMGVIPWSPLARGLLAGNAPVGRADDERAETDAFADSLYTAESTRPSSTASPRSRRRAACPRAR